MTRKIIFEKAARSVLSNPWLIYQYMNSRGLVRWVPDELHCSILFRSIVGYWPDLRNPKTFNEKLQWLKLHDHNSIYPILVDKYAVKDLISSRFGAEYVPKTFDSWKSVDEIDILGLPDRFVLKTNHDSGGIIICRNKSTFDLASAKKKLKGHLKHNYYWLGREWPYKNVRPCVFAEEYIEPNLNNDLPDYKLFHFSNGRIITLLMTDRFTDSETTKTFFDEKWNPLNITEGGHPVRTGHHVPKRFEEMKKITRELARGLPFVRVDFYESGERLLLGEITFYPNSGFEKFEPREWDMTFGSWIELSL